ncbi:cytochrome P450 71A6-like [Salvia hispanica]|uniref:cytochrome P450 71A6-like n=1 Tax=Salvia hispanica TaxID=49212 RepID=UPI0020092ACE|nr:cytochrome P450 71A6-like [Salvia hispanica]
MYAGGTDTTSTTLEWTMAELIRNPRTMKTLQNEVREVVKNKVEVDEDDLEKMLYLKAVTNESLRLHPPIPLLVPRELTQDTKVLGYDIISGTRVLMNAWAIARDSLLWEKPEQFYQERFLETNIDYKGLYFELIPFGAGRRGCPGVTFATTVYELALAKLVLNFNFELPNGAKIEQLDVSESSGLTMHKKFPLLVVVSPHTC